jgi:hypothetical protein
MIKCRIHVLTPTCPTLSFRRESPKGDFRNLRECKWVGTLAPFRGLGVKMRQYSEILIEQDDEES